MNKKLLGGPGASTKGAGVGPALCECIRQGYNYDYYAAVSYSSVIAVPLALNMFKEIEEQSITLNHNKFMDVSPMNSKGKLTWRAIGRAIGSFLAPKRFNSLGVQNVQKLLKQFVTREMFEEYQNGDYPVIYICAVDKGTKKAVLWNIKEKEYVGYDTYLDMVSASSRIPIWTQPQLVTYKGESRLYYDGGITDTNAAMLVLELHNDITEVLSIYPRPEEIKHNSNPLEVNGIFSQKGSMTWMIETLVDDNITDDIKTEQQTCKDRNVKLTQIFLPTVLQSLYDVDPVRLNMLREESVKLVKDTFKTNK